MTFSYPAIFYKETNGYSVIFPDLNYLATEGDTLNDATAMAIDCLSGYISLATMDNDIINNPSPADKLNPYAIAEELGASVDEYFIRIITIDINDSINIDH